MSSRDKVLIIIGLMLTTLGIISTLLWSVKTGLVMALLLGLLLCILFILQRKQMSRVQQRLLKLTELMKQHETGAADSQRRQLILHKRLLGHLQAQQVSLELLYNKLSEMSDADRAQ